MRRVERFVRRGRAAQTAVDRLLDELLHTPWICEVCGAAGSLSHLPAEDPDSVWRSIAEQHAIASPDCHEKHGGRGIRLTVNSTEGQP